MCTSKPKTPPPASQQPQKPVVYMRNAYLDGLGISGETAGRNSLRIDPGSAVARPPAPRPRFPLGGVPPGTTVRPIGGFNPGLGIGGTGGGGYPGLGIRLV